MENSDLDSHIYWQVICFNFLPWQLFFNRDAKQFEGGHGEEKSIVFLYPSKKIIWQLK